MDSPKDSLAPSSVVAGHISFALGRNVMKKYATAAVLITFFVTPALALTSGTYYVGLDTTTHKCSVVTEMKAGMKMMGKYDSKEAAEKAMSSMKECKA